MDRPVGSRVLTYREPLSQLAVAISISESDDLALLGLAEEHLRDAMTEISRHLLAMGARLFYGGDLRDNGFTKLLFELVARHRRDADVGDPRPAVSNHLPWPVHSMKSREYLAGLKDDLEGLGALYCLDRYGQPVAPNSDVVATASDFSDDDWAESLTAMRQTQTDAIHARVVLGGRTTKFKGRMPGIAEETKLALKAKQPLYLLGGFGGCARDIAADIGLMSGVPHGEDWAGRKELSAWKWTDMANGLEQSEIETLARTVHVDQAVALILRGLLRLSHRDGRD